MGRPAVERCHCGRVGLYRARVHGPAYCRAHQHEAASVARAISRAKADASAHQWHEWRQSWIHGPEACARRWRGVA